MDRILGTCACAFMLVGPAPTLAANAELGCESVDFSQEVLAGLPNARLLCRGVMEMDGGVYVKYAGKVVASSEDSTTVELLDKNEKPASRVTFKPRLEQMTWVEDSKVTYRSLKTGARLTFYIEHHRWGLYGAPDGAVMSIVSVQQL